jgi:predicted CopG family antitoxin
MTKVISLSDRAYDVLSELKKEDESFSSLILRLCKKESKKSLLSYAGKWKGDDIDGIFKTILKNRESIASREVKL